MSLSVPPQIQVPLKTAVDHSWIDTLKPIFDKAGNYKTYQLQISTVHDLRNAALKTVEVSPVGLGYLQRYHDQLVCLETKLPSEHIKTPFNWNDAFNKGSFFSSKKSLALPFVAFERLCVIFNVGAMNSQLGNNQGDETDENLKSGAKYFQIAAGFFTQLSECVGVLPKEALTGDLNPDTLSALSSLMLAQAQEIFSIKAINDKMKDSIVAKLCIQTSGMFQEAREKMNQDSPKYTLDKAWIDNARAKETLYKAIAQLYQAKLCSANKIVGEEIARLGLALQLLTESQRRLSTTVTEFYIREVTRLHAAAKKDNDFIYHEIVPGPEKLQEIERSVSAKLAKICPVPERLFEGFTDLFEPIETISPSAMKKPSVLKQLFNTPLKNVFDASLNAMGQYLQSLALKDDATRPK